MEQIAFIYVYCTNSKEHTRWQETHLIVRGIFNDPHELIKQLGDDVAAEVAQVKLPVSVLIITKQKTVQVLKAKGASFMWFQLLSEVIIRLPPSPSAKMDLVKHARAQYQGNAIEESKIAEFEITYSPETCVRWYSRDSFLYRLMNKAFRLQNFDDIFQYRLIIRDLYNQLERIQMNN